MSERSLTRLMLQETGLTFARWHQQLHLIVALRDLAGGASIQQVAGKLGYEPVNAFITMFSKAAARRRSISRSVGKREQYRTHEGWQLAVSMNDQEKCVPLLSGRRGRTNQ